ncbi:hypothetical protein CPB84DRAFT_1693593 [Gymnopilus junonius]|uniref:Uncharacterized protein n=1 Tax=Gymnopilus junonius TaxID=109634 RepID=A0A9P5N6T8_GYMJU|nr:hypothetical protein CPB84DRAFT_1693593 [Gymnopilus junonius]
MPEYRECLAHFLFLLWFLQYCQQKNLDLHVLGLWADKTMGKAAKRRKIPASQDMVFQLNNTSRDKRGNKGNQGFLWPPMWQRTLKNQDSPSINQLEWKGVKTTMRAVILDFGLLHFQLAYLTHTSIQCFHMRTWETVVKPSPCSNRGYRIALAFEFHDYVVAFLSIDNLVQPLWVESASELPPPPTDVYDFPVFLSEVAGWIREWLMSNRSSYACEVIRKDGKKVFGGVGVYTVCELFFDAEVFDCPSQTARLCEAFWTFAHRSHTHLA